AARESAGRSVSERNVPHSPLTLNGLVHERRLRFEITSASSALGESALQVFATHFERALRSCIEHCKHTTGAFTPADFPHASVSQQDPPLLQGEYPLLEDLYVVTPSQAGMLFHGMLDGSGSSYTQQTCCDLIGAVDIEALKAAWRHVVSRHAVLRTC